MNKPNPIYLQNMNNRSEYAVIFDMDGLLLDTEQTVLDCWEAVGEKCNIPNVVETARGCIGMNQQSTRKRFEDTYGPGFSYDDNKKIFREIFAEITQDGKRIPVKCGAVELLLALQENGIRSAVASSTSSGVVKKELEAAGLLPFFDVVIGGEMIEHGKPCPDIFLLACQELGIAPDKGLVLEDSYNGIRAAEAAGIRSIMVPDLLSPTEEMEEKAWYIMENLIEVRQFLMGE